MTTTDPTGAALYRAILAHPDEDTPRLMYADWLDESGTDPDRAEFIRVQVQVARTDYPDLRARESALLAAHRERWLRVECPRCGGGGVNRSDTVKGPYCRECNGTGDAGKLTWGDAYYNRPHDAGAPFHPVVFRRGFPDEAQGCRLADVMAWRQDRCEDGAHYPSPRSGWRPHQPCKTCEGSGAVTGWKPTPWIARVLAHHPIRRVPLVDRVPWQNHAGEWVVGPDFGTPEQVLPMPVWEAMEDYHFATAEDAIDALALATANVIRAHSAPTSRPSFPLQ